MDRIKQDIQGTRNRAGRRCAVRPRLAFALAALSTAGPLAVPASAQLPCSYTVTVLPNSPCFNFQSPANPVAINNLGHVLLYGLNCGEPAYGETYLWTGGPTLTLIPRPAGMLGFTGADLNDNGVIVGQAQYASPTGPRAAIYDTNSGQWTILPPLNPPSGWSGASAISNNNEVCGFRSIGSKGDPVNPQTAFRWSAASGFEDFGLVEGRSTAGVRINSAGVVTVSTGAVMPGAFAYVWTKSGSYPVYPPGCISSDAGVINDLGLLATGGIVQTNPLVLRAFTLWDGTFMQANPLPGATSASFRGISSAGLIAGRSNFGIGPGQTRRACVWVDASPIDLATLVPRTFGGTLQYSWISRDGHIAGWGQDQSGDNKAFMLTPVMPQTGDTNCDGAINVDDLLNVISNWGPCAGCRSDIDGNAVVSAWDLVEVILHWGQ